MPRMGYGTLLESVKFGEYPGMRLRSCPSSIHPSRGIVDPVVVVVGGRCGVGLSGGRIRLGVRNLASQTMARRNGELIKGPIK